MKPLVLLVGVGLVTALAIPTALAYPPSPHHVLFGLVRDEAGLPITATNAVVFLETTSGTKLNTPIVADLEPGMNYKLQVPLDAGVTSDLYNATALTPTVPFRLRVRIGQTDYLPMEMQGDYARLGKPAQKTRLDLTFGEDADGDGLPDAWERVLLSQWGGNATLDDIRPGDDADGDGLSNLQEYLAGTYAFDPEDGFSLSINEYRDGSAVVSFLAIRGHTYTVLGSDNLRDWQSMSFRITPTTPDSAVRIRYKPDDSRVVEAEVPPETGHEVMKFLKLMVQ